MASFSVSPSSDSMLKSFYNSQFCFKPQPPPSTTSFSGQTAIITGSNTGLGLATAQLMLEYGLSHLIMGVRSMSKGEKAAEPLRAKHSSATIDVWELDMMSYSSVKGFAERCSSLQRLDTVILNAGITQSTFTLSPQGHEEAFQVNYLSTALLAFLILPLLKNKSPPATPGRLTIVASGMALTSKFPNRDAVPLIPSFDVLTKWDAAAITERYSCSKTLVLMLVQKLSEVVSPQDVVINAVEPGMIGGTGLQSHQSLPIRAFFAVVKAIAARSVQQGAWAYVDAAAVQGPETHGGLILDWKLASYHAMMYTPEGKRTTQQLWDETLQEFESAGFRGLLGSLK